MLVAHWEMAFPWKIKTGDWGEKTNHNLYYHVIKRLSRNHTNQGHKPM